MRHNYQNRKSRAKWMASLQDRFGKSNAMVTSDIQILKENYLPTAMMQRPERLIWNTSACHHVMGGQQQKYYLHLKMTVGMCC